MKKVAVLITCVILLLVTVGFSFASWYLLDSGSSHISNIKMDNVKDNYYFGTGDPGTAEYFTVTILSKKPELGTNNFVIQNSDVIFQKSYKSGSKVNIQGGDLTDLDGWNFLVGENEEPSLKNIVKNVLKNKGNPNTDVLYIYDSVTNARLGHYFELYGNGEFLFNIDFTVRKNYVFYVEIIKVK